MEGNTVQQPLSKYLIIDTAGFIKNPPLQEFGQNLITLRDVIGKLFFSITTFFVTSELKKNLCPIEYYPD